MAVKIRTYEVKVNLPSPTQADCDKFINFVKDQANRLLESAILGGPSKGVKCFIELKLKCYSCGKGSINSFSKIIRSKYPSIDFITGTGSSSITRL